MHWIFLIAATIRLAQISGGVIVSTVTMNDSLLGGYVPTMLTLDVSARSDAVIGGTVVLGATPLPLCAPACVVVARPDDTFGPMPRAKQVTATQVVNALTIAEGTALLTAIRSGVNPSIVADIAILLSASTPLGSAIAALQDLETRGTLASGRAATLAGTLTGVAQ